MPVLMVMDWEVEDWVAWLGLLDVCSMKRGRYRGRKVRKKGIRTLSLRFHSSYHEHPRREMTRREEVRRHRG